MSERTQKPPNPAPPWEPKQGDGDGPRSPDVSKPETKDLLKRMRKIDPNQSKRYRQRSGPPWQDFPNHQDRDWGRGRDCSRRQAVRVVPDASSMIDEPYRWVEAISNRWVEWSAPSSYCVTSPTSSCGTRSKQRPTKVKRLTDSWSGCASVATA